MIKTKHRIARRSAFTAALSISAFALTFVTSAVTLQPAFADECDIEGSANNGGGATSNPDNATTLACGPETEATGVGATAVGNDRNNNGVGTTAIGDGSTAVGGDALANSTVGDPTGVRATAIGSNSVAINSRSTAIGAQAIADPTINGDADFARATAVGAQAQALNGRATAVGNEAVAGGVRSTALGTQAEAQGDFSTAVGESSIAGGPNSVAVGTLSRARGGGAVAIGDGAQTGNDGGGGPVTIAPNAVAIGRNTQAEATGSVAIGTDSDGAGAFAGQENEFVLGTANHTYTAPGITEPESRARQSGPLELVTTDEDGHLASDGGEIFNRLGEHGAGIAIAMAVENPDLVANETFGLSANVGFFEGNTALGIAAMGVLGHDFMGGGERWALSGGVGFSLNEKDYGGHSTDRTVGGRAGVQVSW